MANDQVPKDIKAAEEERTVCIEKVDGKISAEFCITSGNWNDNSYRETKFDKIFDKIFDNWSDFNDYSDEFFKVKTKA